MVQSYRMPVQTTFTKYMKSLRFNPDQTQQLRDLGYPVEALPEGHGSFIAERIHQLFEVISPVHMKLLLSDKIRNLGSGTIEYYFNYTGGLFSMLTMIDLEAFSLDIALIKGLIETNKTYPIDTTEGRKGFVDHWNQTHPYEQEMRYPGMNTGMTHIARGLHFKSRMPMGTTLIRGIPEIYNKTTGTDYFREEGGFSGEKFSV
jgi:hypothetical protein